MSIPLRTVGKKHFNFDLRIPKSTRTEINNIHNSELPNDDYRICGEDIIIMALAESDNATVHHATLTDPCKYLAKTDMAVGSPVQILRDGKHRIPNAIFDVNSTVFLTNLTPGTPVIPNLTTTPPSLATGEVFQIIGYTPGHPTDTTTEWMYIKIEEPEWRE